MQHGGVPRRRDCGNRCAVDAPASGDRCCPRRAERPVDPCCRRFGATRGRPVQGRESDRAGGGPGHGEQVFPERTERGQVPDLFFSGKRR
ncbi:hypothetical protein BC826DRAFT_1054629 [Russula brevipes]|nr:hypothetical protein BC826DRAFT_1054629 [Russula brevipes]